MFLILQEWHAKQIASGEAKDNANFQPLGGDWYVFDVILVSFAFVIFLQHALMPFHMTSYFNDVFYFCRRERVKRKRAKVASESVDSTHDTVEGNKQPDLIELSKDLPSGWQVCVHFYCVLFVQWDHFLECLESHSIFGIPPPSGYLAPFLDPSWSKHSTYLDSRK